MTDKQIEQIGDFLNGEMGPEEKKSFEQELETDPALLVALNTYRAVEANMQHANVYTSEYALKRTLDDLNAEFFKVSPKETDNIATNDELLAGSKKISIQAPFLNKSFPKKNQVWKLIAAAIFFGVIATGTWYLLKGKKDKGQIAITTKKPISTTNIKKADDTNTLIKTPALADLALHDTLSKTNLKKSKDKEAHTLFAKYFKPDTAPEEKGDALEDAFFAYNKKEYKKSAAAFEKADLELTRGDGLDVQLTKFYASYYGALSFLAIGKDDKAIKQLESLSTATDPLLRTKVGWYLTLAYLKTNKFSQAILLLNAISRDKAAGGYIPKANKLMIDIRKIK